MRVCSWRFWSSAGVDSDAFERLSGFSAKASLHQLQAAFVVIGVGGLSACISAPESRSIFMTPGISSTQWERMRAECNYEAEKAVASADPKTPTEFTARRLFAMCVELKGAKYVGRVTMPEVQSRPLADHCNKEADRAELRGATKQARDWEREEIEIACLKRSAAFHAW